MDDRYDPRRIEVIDEATARRMRALSPSRRVLVGFDLTEFAWQVIRMGVRRQHPELDETATQRETDRRFRLAPP